MLSNPSGKFYIPLFLSGFIVLFSSSLMAEPQLEVPQINIHKTSVKLQELIKKEGDNLQDITRVREVVKEFIEPHIDFNRISAMIVGRKHWKTATADQQERFKQEFKELLIRTYATAFNSFKEWSIRFLPSRQSKNKRYVTVRSKILRPGGAPPVDVNYKMVEKRGEWKIFDVSIEGISVVTNYQKTIKREIRQANGSLEAVIQRLAKKNARSIKVAEVAKNS